MLYKNERTSSYLRFFFRSSYLLTSTIPRGRTQNNTLQKNDLKQPNCAKIKRLAAWECGLARNLGECLRRFYSYISSSFDKSSLCNRDEEGLHEIERWSLSPPRTPLLDKGLQSGRSCLSLPSTRRRRTAEHP